MAMVHGHGSPTQTLSKEDVRSVVQTTASDPNLVRTGERVLLVIPDATRTCPMGMMLRLLEEAWGPLVERMDVLIALGTHQPMTDDAIAAHCGFAWEDRERLFPKTTFYNHEWDNPQALKTIGRISSAKMSELTGGRFEQTIDVAINRRIFDYDRVTIVGPTFPHEVVGFSGGNKYFFPGIAGQDIIDAFHWVGALITNREIIGTRRTPVRDIVDHCASMIPIAKSCVSLVVGPSGLHGVFAGTPEAAYDQAARLSAQVNVRWVEKPYRLVISICPKMYPELWTAGKCMYKLEPAIAKGGRLIIYAPHIAEVSRTHGAKIEAIGYHVLPYFASRMDRFARIPGGVLAHSTHVKGSGEYRDGVETPDVEVVLATGLSPEACTRINLGYQDWRSLNLDDYRGREEEGVLVVEKAGEVLYRVGEPPSLN